MEYVAISFSRVSLWPRDQAHISCISYIAVHAKSLQSWPTLCYPMDCSPPDPSVHGDSPGKNTRVDCHDLLHGILPPGIEPTFLMSLALAGGYLTTSATWEAYLTGGFFTTERPGKPLWIIYQCSKKLRPSDIFPSILWKQPIPHYHRIF